MYPQKPTVSVFSFPERNPWYVVPADQKFFARYLVSEAVVAALEACDPDYPKLSEEDLAALEACRARLEA